MNRREFLKRSAVTPALASTLGTVGPPADAPRRIRCGFLGINHSHALDALKVVRASPDYELAGVCEPDDAVRAAFQDRPELDGVPWLSQDELLGDETVRMIAVEGDVPRLLPLGRAAVDAGKHIHLDKPAGTSLPEFRALLDEAARQNLIVQMGYMFRYNPGFDLVRRAVTEGWLGRVYSIHAGICTNLNPEKRKIVAHHPGGLMLELGSHLIDLIVLLLGAPAKVTPFIRHDAPIDDALADNTLAVLEYDRAIVTVESAAMEPHAFTGRRFKVCGTEGSVTLAPLEPPGARLCLEKPAGEFQPGTHAVEFEDLQRHVLDLADLAQCIRGNSQFAYTKAHDLAVQETLLRACGVAP